MRRGLGFDRLRWGGRGWRWRRIGCRFRFQQTSREGGPGLLAAAATAGLGALVTALAGLATLALPITDDEFRVDVLFVGKGGT